MSAVAARGALATPAVIYPVRRTALLGAILFALWLSGAAAVAFALASEWSQFSGISRASMLSCLLLLALALMAFWRGHLDGVLIWDGTHWHLDRADAASTTPAALVRVEIRFDFQAVVLLCCTEANTWRHTWLWAQQRMFPERWHLLRCALYAEPGVAVRPQSDRRSSAV